MNTAAHPPAASQDRQIRVFISSTFRDMQTERDYLVKFIFPQLRKLCEARGVTWGEVDLRWGVTDEQAAEGKVLPICLEEIKRCRPYFIGLLGERYGWIPDALPADLIEREEWLKEHLNGKTSVTELEILHGVLNDPQMAGHAFFYFRDPAYLNTVAEKDRKDFTAENTKDTEKLCALKDRIRQSKFAVRENYPEPKALGELVLTDLTKVINDTWPEGSQPDPLDREAMDHEAYAQSRERVYIGRQEYFDRLDAHASGREDHPLVVLGESGSGKSALLANWVARYRQAHPDALVLQHYISATPYSADWAAMLRRLMGEFKRRLGIQQDIPDQPDALRSAFPNWLYTVAAAKGRVVLVLDALNQLEDRDGAPDLVWLPPVLPENVRLIVSTLPGRPLDEIQKRHWPTLKVELLSANERRNLIAEYLAQHAKSLNAARVERIAAAPASANPLYLRVLLDELRVVRTHEELEERISDYLKAESPYALYEKVIARWEQDYEGDSDLVGDTLSLLWAARRGLTETELLQALGKDGEPLPRAKWSPLRLALDEGLVNRGGILNFAHDYLRSAVRQKFLLSTSNQSSAHLHLADYFQGQAQGYRKFEEMAWQLAEAKAWRRLFEILTDIHYLSGAWAHNATDVMKQWADLEMNSTFRMKSAYCDVFSQTQCDNRQLCLAAADLLRKADHTEECFALCSDLAAWAVEHKHGGVFDFVLATSGEILMKWGRNDEALSLLTELERSGQSKHNEATVRTAVNLQALVLQRAGKHDDVIRILGHEVDGVQDPEDSISRAVRMSNLALSLSKVNPPENALTVLREAQAEFARAGKSDFVAATMLNEAWTLRDIGKFNDAMVLICRAEDICVQTGEIATLIKCLGNKALVAADLGQSNEALSYVHRQQALAYEIENNTWLCDSLDLEATLLVKMGHFTGAEQVLAKEEEISRTERDTDRLVSVLGTRAAVLEDSGRLQEALAVLSEQERIAEETGDQNNLQAAFGNQGCVLNQLKQPTAALAKFKQQALLCRQIENWEGLATSLSNQAQTLLSKFGQKTDALPLAEEAYQLAISYGFMALVEQIKPILNSVRQATDLLKSSLVVPHALPRDITIPELRDSAAAALRRGLWEAAATYLERLLQQGEPVETVAPNLITCLLNAHENPLESHVKRIESLLQQLEQAGHMDVAAPLRQQLQAKLPRKKKGWKFW